jgi:histidine triad (HIT) family protein
MAFLSHNIFADIIAGTIPADVVHETPTILAFKDIAPKAKTHIVIIPKQCLKTAKEVTPQNTALFGELFLAAKDVAQKLGLPGYKLHMNVDEPGGQVVPHVHLHLLSADYQSNL